MYKISIIGILVQLVISTSCYSQDNDSPYSWDWKKDGIWLGAGFGGSVGGLLIGKEKTPYTEEQLNALDKNDLFVLDRWAAGNYSKNASVASDYPFYGSFVVPFALLLDDKINNETATVLGLYLESLATTSAIFTITAGLVDRPRPLVFSEDAPLERRLRKTSKRSFYSGHVAASATAMFFAAKVYSDFHPRSPLRPYFWTAAFTVPAAIGYLRLKAGKHYLTDIVLGYTLGALTGYLVPELHKKKEKSFQLYPSAGLTPMGREVNGLAIRYSF
ncbi:phosphatase PAP2 family protein [Maribacter sp. 2307UL18-2]|uniref:phosphatase PAP2 family protein n=1 Tax=Maribacter sp. 2307UL18-2 TaxID=3386274 RepID=UPI0039BCB623